MYVELCDDDFDPTIQAEEVGGAEWRKLDVMAIEGSRMARLVERVRALPESMLAWILPAMTRGAGLLS